MIQLYIVVSCDREGLTIGREGVVRNGVVEEVVDFGPRHS